MRRRYWIHKNGVLVGAGQFLDEVAGRLQDRGYALTLVGGDGL